MVTIILEGIDRSGKSTFANILKDAAFAVNRKALIRHYGKPTEKSSQELYQRYVDDFNEAKAAGNDLYILDRSFFGNWVYSQFYAQTKLNNEHLVELQDYFFKNGTNSVLIFFKAPAKAIKARFAKDKEKFTSTKDIKSILRLYDLMKKDVPFGWNSLELDSQLLEKNIDVYKMMSTKLAELIIKKFI